MNVGARLAGTALNYYMNRPPAPQFIYPPTPPSPQVVLASNPPRGRGRRGGRGRGRGRGRGNARQAAQPGGIGVSLGASSGASVVLRDTEIVGTLNKTMFIAEMNPGVDAMVRLKQHEAMYSRYKIRFMNISYKPLVGTANDSSVRLGIAVGPKLSNVTTADDIAKLRPNVIIPGWKAENISVGSMIDSSRFMFCGDTTRDGVSFTIYAIGSKDAIGLIQCSYEVVFSFPRPF